MSKDNLLNINSLEEKTWSDYYHDAKDSGDPNPYRRANISWHHHTEYGQERDPFWDNDYLVQKYGGDEEKWRKATGRPSYEEEMRQKAEQAKQKRWDAYVKRREQACTKNHYKDTSVCGVIIHKNDPISFIITQISGYKADVKQALQPKVTLENGLTEYSVLGKLTNATDTDSEAYFKFKTKSDIKEGDIIEGVHSYYRGAPVPDGSSYFWYHYIDKAHKQGEELPVSSSSSANFEAGQTKTLTINSLFKKEMQSKKNPGETYFMYIAKDDDGQKFMWFSKSDFKNGDKVTGEQDSLSGSSIKLKGVKMTESKVMGFKEKFKKFYRFNPERFREFFDEDTWRRSKKGQQEKDWWLNRCHIEYDEERWPDHTVESYDAGKSFEYYGKIFVDDDTDKPVSFSYVTSLLKSWGEPNQRVKESEESKDTVEVYQVVKDTDVHSSLGEDVSNQKPVVVTEHDCEECAKEKANELNATVTSGEKAVLGTEYSVQKKEIELKESESVGPYYAVVNYGNIGSPIYAHGPYDTKEEAQERAKFIRKGFGSYERYCHAWCRVMTQKDIDRADRRGYGYKIQVPKKRVTESSESGQFVPDEDDQRPDIYDFVNNYIQSEIVNPYVYDHDVEGLATELAGVMYHTSRLAEDFEDEYGYAPYEDIFEDVVEDAVQEAVSELTYKEGFEDLNELFCQEFD